MRVGGGGGSDGGGGGIGSSGDRCAYCTFTSIHVQGTYQSRILGTHGVVFQIVI